MEDFTRYVVLGGASLDKWNESCIGESFFIDDIYYKVLDVEHIEHHKVGLKLIELKGVELLEAELEDEKAKVDKCPRKFLPATIRALNEDYVNIVSIIPLQVGEDFARYLRYDIFDDSYDDDDCKFSYSHRVWFDEEWNEWSFGRYKFLVIFRYEDIDYCHFYVSLDEISFDIEKDAF